jgi:gliding motility-associated-like protein
VPDTLFILWGDGAIDEVLAPVVGSTHTHTYTTGDYQIQIVARNVSGCDSVYILPDRVVVPAPVTVNLQPDNRQTVFNDEAEVVFTGTVTGPAGTSWTWDVKDGAIVSGSITGVAPLNDQLTGDFPQITTRWVALIGDDGQGCVVRDSVEVETRQTQFLFIPTVFTPDGDGTNDFFTAAARGLEYQAWIYDRWGNEVATFRHTDRGWNGQHQNGGDCPEGVYVYRFRVIDTVDNEEQIRSGTVTLLR